MALQKSLLSPFDNVSSMSAQEPEVNIDSIINRPLGQEPLLVFGGPGTGKTTALAQRAVKLINDGHIDASHVLVFTPSRNSAEKLRADISAGIEKSFQGKIAYTWASYCFEVLTRAYQNGYLPEVTQKPRLLTGAEQDTLIATLLEGHIQQKERGELTYWPSELEPALGTKAFRGQIRNFFDRLQEYRLTVDQLLEYADLYDKPEWESIAKLYREYQMNVSLQFPHAFDPSNIIGYTHNLLETHKELLEDEQERFSVLMVDNIHEFNPGVFEFIDLLSAGKDLVFTADPTVTVQGFRGARPDLVSKLKNIDGLEEHVLTEGFRLNRGLVEAYKNIARQTSGYGTKFSLGLEPNDMDSSSDSIRENHQSVDVHELSSPMQELRFLTQEISELFLLDGVDFNDIAIIARNGTIAQEVARYLQTQDIPTDVAGSGISLKNEMIVQQLLEFYVAAIPPRLRSEYFNMVDGSTTLSPEHVKSLLTSVYGQATALDIRRLKQHLKKEYLKEAATLSAVEENSLDQSLSLDSGSAVYKKSDDLLVELLEEMIEFPDRLSAELDSGHGHLLKPVQRVSQMIRAGRNLINNQAVGKVQGSSKEILNPNFQVYDLLWALWDQSGLSTQWAQQATDPSNDHRTRLRNHQRLDTVMALFNIASRYAKDHVQNSVQNFYDEIINQDVEVDSLALNAVRPDVVSILTPSTASGREFDYVFIPSVQESTWPNLKIRGQAFDENLLSKVVEKKVTPEEYAHIQRQSQAKVQDISHALSQVRDDELRTFAAAVSRGKKRVTVSAFSNDEQNPSYFLDLVDSQGNKNSESKDTANRHKRDITHVQGLKTLRGVTAQLRREGQKTAEIDDMEAAGNPAVTLAYINKYLESHGSSFKAADPQSWWGLSAVSSDAKVFEDSIEKIPVSPSKIQSVHDFPLFWLFEAAGGQEQTDSSRSLGTFIHKLVEENPHGTQEQFEQALEARWHEIVSTRGWQAEIEKDRAKNMLKKLADYIETMQSYGRSAVDQDQREKHVEAPVGRALVRGSIDRVDTDEEGNRYIVDFKTNKTPISIEEGAKNLQLAAYQLALAFNDLDESLSDNVSDTGQIRGAEMVYIGTGAQAAAVRSQEAVDLESQTLKYEYGRGTKKSVDTVKVADFIEEAAELMAARIFETHHGDKDHADSWNKLCPLCNEGKQVTE